MRFGGRKFLMAIYLSTGLFVLCWFGRVPGIACASAVAAISAVYKAANAYEACNGNEYDQGQNR